MLANLTFFSSVIDESLNIPNIRKPLTGILSLKIHSVKDVDHASISRFSKGPETFITVKVEDAVKARTKATRNDRWQDEVFNIAIDKANELEVTVYDKSGDRPNPIGMLWIRISDIAEEMRRKKMESEFNASGWVSADRMAGHDPGTHVSPQSHSPESRVASGATAHAATSNGPVVINSWFSLEPVGRVHLTMSFGKKPYIPLYRLNQKH